MITALSEGRGYGEAGGEGLLCSLESANPSPTASRSPSGRAPSPASGRGLLSSDISRLELNVETPRAGVQPRRQSRPNSLNNLRGGLQYGGAEAPPFRGPKLPFFRRLLGVQAGRQLPGRRLLAYQAETLRLQATPPLSASGEPQLPTAESQDCHYAPTARTL